MAVVLEPEAIFFIGSFPVTNTIINTLIVDAAILSGVLALNKNLKKVPGMFQNIFEIVIDTFYTFTESISGKNAPKIFPWVMSFFLFILIANWSGLLPGNGTIGVWHEVHHEKELIPVVRNLTSDINATLGLALISLLVTHILSIRTVGIGEYLSRYFSLNPIMLFVGLLEIVSEITKIVSLSFRLFGNIFAGEVVLLTVSKLTAFSAFLVPIPFILLEIIVGLVQALVFSILTMVFMSILMTPHHAEKH